MKRAALALLLAAAGVAYSAVDQAWLEANDGAGGKFRGAATAMVFFVVGGAWGAVKSYRHDESIGNAIQAFVLFGSFAWLAGLPIGCAIE